MSAPRFVRLLAVLAAVATALVAAFPLWGVANADEGTSYVATHQRGGPRGDRNERHGRDRVNATCTITVPANPLSADGLTTPYVLNNGNADCSMANGDTAAFVEATIVDGAGNLSVYRPLVITHGTKPAVDPTPVTLPADGVVGIWFGFQGDALKLVGPGAGDCVNGLGNSLFGQFAYCNAPAFFAAAKGVQAPPLGMAPDGKPCPTVRDFFVVDQDQSDNVSTVYRIDGLGRTAQDTAATANLDKVVNASDNGLLNRKIIGSAAAPGALSDVCQNFTAADLTNPGSRVPSLALNEIQARQQVAPVALIPLNDPMAQVNGKPNLGKVNLYRLGVGQPAGSRWSADGARYCKNLQTIYPQRRNALQARLAATTSPEAGMTLLQFMDNRFAASLTELGCRA